MQEEVPEHDPVQEVVRQLDQHHVQGELVHSHPLTVPEVERPLDLLLPLVVVCLLVLLVVVWVFVP